MKSDRKPKEGPHIMYQTHHYGKQTGPFMVRPFTKSTSKCVFTRNQWGSPIRLLKTEIRWQCFDNWAAADTVREALQLKYSVPQLWLAMDEANRAALKAKAAVRLAYTSMGDDYWFNEGERDLGCADDL